MGKPNTYLLLRQAQKEIVKLKVDLEAMKGFTIQHSQDMAIIALHRHFGFGPDRCQKFAEAFRSIFVEYANLCVDDGQDDSDLDYTKAVLDRELTEACGEIKPFEQRYALENLFFRDRDLKG